VDGHFPLADLVGWENGTHGIWEQLIRQTSGSMLSYY
jgi:hypothetical protein